MTNQAVALVFDLAFQAMAGTVCKRFKAMLTHNMLILKTSPGLKENKERNGIQKDATIEQICSFGMLNKHERSHPLI